ncbi:SRPBCC family protein [Fervidibacillus halotolerans]|uniref:SRPBCC family protein n=1 Tax=Fervidibacillus halotolerans TaxID=2980027 RepID=A0A9E8RZA3_9BACI|nr:SRPBCC family protein [Fervidibacillus halotolerans]WAA13113.1 SRPBCC family protein [Fervidibacillus halotolerans]
MKEIVVFRCNEEIDAPIDVVFQYLNEDEKIKLWNPLLIENLYEENRNDQAQPKPSGKFKTVQKIGNHKITVDVELKEYNPPYKVVLQSHSKEGISITKYYLSKKDTKTHLFVEESIIPSNLWYKLVAKLFSKAGLIPFKKQYKNLKLYVETL